jgi:glyoxylate reductase
VSGHVYVTRLLVDDAMGALVALADEHGIDLVVGHEEPPSRDELLSGAAGAAAVVCTLTERIDAAVLDAAGPDLRVVANVAVGYDNVDVAAARERGVVVTNTPGVLDGATADLTMALVLAITRRLPDGVARVRDGRWGPWQPAQDLGMDLAGATLGIVGYGRIGRAVAARAQAFGMEVLHTSRSSGVTLDELLGSADVVSLHVPLSPLTHHLIDSVALARMKPTAYLVNTARGGVVDQAALRDALHQRRLAGAALDVTDPEPLPADDPLLDAPNLLVVPHIGSATAGTRAKMAAMAVDNLLAALDGRPMPHPAG